MKRPYECKLPNCDKKFTTRFSLRRHITTHMPSKQFVCVICQKKFALGQYLKEHTYIHTGQKPFKCQYENCNKAFRQAGKLSLHKKFHENKIFIVSKMKKKNQFNSPKGSSTSPSLILEGMEISHQNLYLENSPSQHFEFNENKIQDFMEDGENTSSLQRMETSTNTNECQEQQKLINEISIAPQQYSPQIKVNNVEQTNFNQLQKHFDTSMQGPNQQLINQIVDKLQYPEMVLKRFLPIPNKIMSYQYNPSNIRVLQKVGGLYADEKVITLTENSGPSNMFFQNMMYFNQ